MSAVSDNQIQSGDRVSIRCECMAVIEETWVFTIPDGWESMSQEEREEAITWAAPDGDFIDDRIIGGEGDREWDLDSIEVDR